MSSSSTISFNDFIKIDLRIGVVKNVERIPGSTKLYKLIVDLGEIGTRQLVAGIAEHYTPEELIGRNIVVVVNLEPKKIFGVMSEGMLLAADENGTPVLLTTIKSVKPGTRVK